MYKYGSLTASRLPDDTEDNTEVLRWQKLNYKTNTNKLQLIKPKWILHNEMLVELNK